MSGESAIASGRSWPTVSVIVPTLGRRDMLEQLLASFEKLTYPVDRFEVVVVDNGSTDGTWEWLQQAVAEKHFTIRCVRSAKTTRRGPPAARNQGCAMTTGDIIAFTDSDCEVSPQWLENGVAKFTDGVGIVQGRTLPSPDDATPALLKTTTVVSHDSFAETCNIFYTREAFERVGGFAKDFIDFGYPMFGEDIDLACRVRGLGYQLVFAGDALVYHRNRKQTFTQWLLEPRMAFTWPYIVKKHPQVRRQLFGRWFLHRLTALFNLALLGVLLAAIKSAWFLLLALPFAVFKYRDGGAHLSQPMRLVRVGGAMLRGLIIFGVLLCGSIRFRSVLL